MGPRFVVIYLRALLEAYRMDRNPRWYRIAASVGAEAPTSRAFGRPVPARLGRLADRRHRHTGRKAADRRRDDERAGLAGGAKAAKTSVASAP
jgi:hypothetical protein